MHEKRSGSVPLVCSCSRKNTHLEWLRVVVVAKLCTLIAETPLARDTEGRHDVVESTLCCRQNALEHSHHVGADCKCCQSEARFVSAVRGCAWEGGHAKGQGPK